jgi:hypothetical protein
LGPKREATGRQVVQSRGQMAIDKSVGFLDKAVTVMERAVESSLQVDADFKLVESHQHFMVHVKVMSAVLNALQEVAEVPQVLLGALLTGITHYKSHISPTLQKNEKYIDLLVSKILFLCVMKLAAGFEGRPMPHRLSPPLSIRKMCAGLAPGKVNDEVHEIILDVLGGEKRLFQGLETIGYLRESIELRRQLMAKGSRFFAIPKIGPFPQVHVSLPPDLPPLKHIGGGMHAPLPLPGVSLGAPAMDEYKRLFSYECFVLIPILPENIPTQILMLQCRLSQLMKSSTELDPDSAKFHSFVNDLILAQKGASKDTKHFFESLFLQTRFVESHGRFVRSNSQGIIQLHRWAHLNEDAICERSVALDSLICSYRAWIEEFNSLAQATKKLCIVPLADEVQRNLTEKWDIARLKFVDLVERALAIYHDPQNIRERIEIYRNSSHSLKQIYEAMPPSRRRNYHPRMVFSDIFSTPLQRIRRESPEEFEEKGKKVLESFVDVALKGSEEAPSKSSSFLPAAAFLPQSPPKVAKKRPPRQCRRIVACSPELEPAPPASLECVPRHQMTQGLPVETLPAKSLESEIAVRCDEVSELTARVAALSLETEPPKESSVVEHAEGIPLPLPPVRREALSSTLMVGDGPVLEYEYDPRVTRWSLVSGEPMEPFLTDPRYIGCPHDKRQEKIRLHDVPYVAHKVLLLLGERFGLQEERGYERISYALIADASFDDGGFHRGVLTLARSKKKIFHVSMSVKAPSTIYDWFVEHGQLPVSEEVKLDEEKMAIGTKVHARLGDDMSRIISINEFCIQIRDPLRKATWELTPFG